MRIRWTPAAVSDLQSISDYLKDPQPKYRHPTLRRMYERIRGLRDLPYTGRPGRESGTREILFPPMPYVAVYRVREKTLEVVRVYHTAQDRP